MTKLRCGSMMYDDVPGVLLAREAGARVTSFEDRDYTYETLSFVIGTPNLMKVIDENFDEIAEIIRISEADPR